MTVMSHEQELWLVMHGSNWTSGGRDLQTTLKMWRATRLVDHGSCCLNVLVVFQQMTQIDLH